MVDIFKCRFCEKTKNSRDSVKRHEKRLRCPFKKIGGKKRFGKRNIGSFSLPMKKEENYDIEDGPWKFTTSSVSSNSKFFFNNEIKPLIIDDIDFTDPIEVFDIGFVLEVNWEEKVHILE